MEQSPWQSERGEGRRGFARTPQEGGGHAFLPRKNRDSSAESERSAWVGAGAGNSRIGEWRIPSKRGIENGCSFPDRL